MAARKLDSEKLNPRAPSSRIPLSLGEQRGHALTDSPTSMFRQLDIQLSSTPSSAGPATSKLNQRPSRVAAPSWDTPSPGQTLANPIWPPTPEFGEGGVATTAPLTGSSTSSFTRTPSPKTQNLLSLDPSGDEPWSPLTPSYPLPPAPRMAPRNFSSTDLSQIRTGYTPQASQSDSIMRGDQSPSPSLYAFMSPPGTTRGLLPAPGERPTGAERSTLRNELDLGLDDGQYAEMEDVQPQSASLLSPSSLHSATPTGPTGDEKIRRP